MVIELLHTLINSYSYSSYDEKGNLKSKIERKPPNPVKLSFDLDNEELVNAINEAYKDSQEIVDVSR